MADDDRRRSARIFLVSALAATTALVATSGAVAGDSPGFNLSRDWYVSGFAATLIADENNILFEDLGWRSSVAAGRRFHDGRFRVELEGARRQIGLVGLNGAGEAPGQFSGVAGFVNGYVHFRPNGVIDPYLGAGFGRGRQNYQLRGRADRLDYEVVMDDDSEADAHQVIGGLEFDITPRVSGHVEGRFFKLADKTIGANFGRWNGHEKSYQLGFGLSYSIGN